MGIQLDPTTMFVALMAATVAAVLLLLWTFLLNRHERSLLWVAVAFLCGSLGILSMAGRELIPTWAHIELGVASLLFGIGLLLVAARTFNGKSPQVWRAMVGPGIWIAACLLPGFAANFTSRMVLSSLIIGTYYALAGLEFRVSDGLKTRIFATAIFLLQTAFVLVRIPFVLLDSTAGTPSFADTSWFSFSALESAVFVQILGFLMISLTKERVELRLRDAALTDALTGLGNRRAFFEWGEAAVARSLRTGSPVTIILVDLDRFKEINDRFGHPVGDAVIQAFANVAEKRVRTGDFVARLGGEEFAIALPDTPGPSACAVASEINRAFAAAVDAMDPPGVVGTASAGVAQSAPAARTLADLLTAADRALYDAKALGRGQVLLAETKSPPLRVHAA